MTETSVETPAPRPKRVCDVCGGFDAAPRHQIAHPVGTIPVNQAMVQKFLANVTHEELATPDGAKALVDLMDTSTELRHLDCCKSVGCVDGTCNVVTQGAEDLKDEELQAHLEGRTPDLTETVFVEGRPNHEVLAELTSAQNTEF